MATLVLQIPDESLVNKVKQACKMIVGVASVKVVSKREKSQACLSSSEREQAQAQLKVQKPAQQKEFDITKTKAFQEALDDVKHGRVTHYDSVDDMFKSVLGEEAFSKIRSQHV